MSNNCRSTHPNNIVIAYYCHVIVTHRHSRGLSVLSCETSSYGHLQIVDKSQRPTVSGIERFHCIILYYCIVLRVNFEILQPCIIKGVSY